MSDIGEEISRLAEEFDPVRVADAEASRSLIQGALVGALYNQDFIKVDINQAVEIDADGGYSYPNHFFVVTGSGHQVRVTVEVVE